MMINEFLNYLKFERNRSDLTIKNYGEDLRAFEEFYGNLDSRLSWESVDSDIIRDWMESMMDKGNNATSINRRLSALRSFYRFALARKLVGKDPVHGVTGPKKGRPLPQFLKENEMDRLLDAESWTESFEDVRDRMVIMTFYETGIRLSELIGLDDSMVDFSNRQLKVTGKRNKQRVIPFGEELLAMFHDYMKCRDKEVNRQPEALFVT
ncbi:MAG: site-specific integrase, partial [Prevotella salivae]|nr:site-specific integrase [Segatella salivae]